MNVGKTTNRQRVLLKRAFTLIEILVVISIIVILAAILFPVFARARENARRASCASNLKQISLATIMYTQDYDGTLPVRIASRSSIEPVIPYIKNRQVHSCPSAPTNRRGVDSTSQYSAHYGFPVYMDSMARGYGVRTVLMGNPDSSNQRSVKLDSLPHPSITCLVGEVYYSVGTMGDRYPVNYENNGWGFPYFNTKGGSLIRDRHLDGSNYAYLDGHVKWLKKDIVNAMRRAQTAETGLVANGRARNRNGAGFIESLGGWREFPIIFGWAIEDD